MWTTTTMTKVEALSHPSVAGHFSRRLPYLSHYLKAGSTNRTRVQPCRLSANRHHALFWKGRAPRLVMHIRNVPLDSLVTIRLIRRIETVWNWLISRGTSASFAAHVINYQKITRTSLDGHLTKAWVTWYVAFPDSNKAVRPGNTWFATITSVWFNRSSNVLLKSLT